MLKIIHANNLKKIVLHKPTIDHYTAKNLNELKQTLDLKFDSYLKEKVLGISYYLVPL